MNSEQVFPKFFGKLIVFLFIPLLIGVASGVEFKITFEGVNTTLPPYFKAKAYFLHYEYQGGTFNPGSPANEFSPPPNRNADEFDDSGSSGYPNLYYPDGSVALGPDTYDDEMQYYVFKIPVHTSRIIVSWRGHAYEAEDDVELFIYSWSTSSWYGGESVGWFMRGTSLTWINFTLPSPSDFISPNGYVHIAAVADLHGETYGRPRADYIELLIDVPESAMVSSCVRLISSQLRDWDGIFDDDAVGVVARVAKAVDDQPIAYYTVYLKAEYSGNSVILGSGVTNVSGYANIFTIPKNAGDRWRVNFSVFIQNELIDGIAYRAQETCSEKGVARNVAVTPGSYDIVLVGRYYDVGGADWVRIRWVAESSDVDHVVFDGYEIPVSAGFKTWDFFLWKIGAVEPNNDNDFHFEGVNHNVNDFGSESYPACIGPDANRSGFCGQWAGNCRDGRNVYVYFLVPVYVGTYPSGCCVREREGNVFAGDCGRFMSGYRFSTLVQFNVPDHNLGEPGKAAIFLCEEYSTLSGLLSSTPYTGHEGPGRITCTVRVFRIIEVQQQPNSTEGLFYTTYSFLGGDIVRRHPHGGLGLISLVGLWPDNEHVVAILLGHRFGIHPFVAIVTSMPSGSYPSDDQPSEWNLQFMQVWLYHLLKNLAYGIAITADEFANLNLRYPESGEDNVVLANRVITSFVVDFLPYLEETIWLLEVSGNNTIKPFIVAIFTQFYDLGRMMKFIASNETLKDEFANVTKTFISRFPDLVGDPSANSGVNYILKHRTERIPLSEKTDTAYHFMKLLDQIASFLVTIVKHVPMMEYYNTSYSPGWSWSWISNSPT
ncbi:MAG: hypothetical protein QXP28_01165 [Archaeoglobaceae archaeon]